MRQRLLAVATLAAAAAASTLAATPIAAQSPPVDDPVLRRIWALGMDSSQTERLAQTLFDSIGPRLTGTPDARRGNDWLVKTYGSWGIPARNEQFGTWRGWRRGASHIDLVSPRVRSLEGTMLGYSPGTGRKPLTAATVILPRFADSAAFVRWLPSARGKLVLVAGAQPTCRPRENWAANATPASRARMDSLRDSVRREWGGRNVRGTGYSLAIGTGELGLRLEQGGVAGIVTSRPKDAWGSIEIFETYDTTAPAIALSCEDYGLVYRLTEHGQGARLRLDLDAELLGEGPVFNTVATVRGSAKPDEYVVLSSHFDSWDGASGATDNGTGTLTMLEAMRILRLAYPHPKRTIIAVRRLEHAIAGQFGGLQKLCTPDAKSDPFSDKVNYYVGATLRQPVLFGLRSVPTVTLFSEVRSEFNAFRRTTPIGGIASLAVRRRVPMTLAYELSLRRTTAQPALFCAVFNVCDEATRLPLEQSKRLAVASVAFTRDRANSAVNPSRGTVARLELRHASRLIFSDPTLQFNKGLGDGSWYVTAGHGNVLALRLRVGAVLGTHLSLRENVTTFIPPEERLFAGGSTTVRGFRQNELGPLLYVARSLQADTLNDSTFAYRVVDSAGYERAVPSGGNSLVVANAEYRMRSPFLTELLQWTVFTDAGAVWDRGRQGLKLSSRTFRVTPGIGLRVYTPVGPLRVDVGYNPYAQPAGPAYYSPPLTNAGNAPLYCVSPGNTLLVHKRTDAAGNTVFQQDPGNCPTTFEPQRRSGFLSRLTPTFSIQQAF